jgi:transcription-repair coupling factor (superfamily II helicase)
MLRFLSREIDVLVCSTIIESGVDFPNANTMVILDAHKLGLAQLYQLRGRVGRSTRMAYAYLTVPVAQAVSEVAQKRLLAIREFTQFGAGFRLAMRDLEIRGAGSLLGADQHGHITDVGYEYYCKLMRRAVSEARGEKPEETIETTVDIPVDAYIPKSFLPSELHRLAMYKRIAEITGNDSFTDLLDEFNDRYGDLPEPVMNLMRLSLIRAYAHDAGLLDVTVKNGTVRLKYDESARPDGLQLLSVLSSEAGARLIGSGAPVIEWRPKAENVNEIVRNLPQFLYRLKHCIAPQNDL